MNLQKACQLLDISIDDKNDIDIIKKQYHRKALQLHPDKNKDNDASSQFQEVQNAYQYLYEKYNKNDVYDDVLDDESEYNRDGGYQNALYSFLKNIWNTDETSQKIFYMIVSKIANCYEAKALEILYKIDRTMLIKIRTVFYTYKDVFHFSEDFLKALENVIEKKTQNDECIILNPFLDDLFENNLYKLVEKGGTFVIPLWHHELVYDNSGADLYINMSPILPENVVIDEKNDIHVHLKYNIQELWEKSVVHFELGKRLFGFAPEQLKLMRNQTFFFYNSGISKINTENIYDITKKSDIIVHIEIV